MLANKNMGSILTFFNYSILFVSVFTEVFLLITLFEKRNHINSTHLDEQPNDADCPEVTILIPVFNEEKTVGKTIESLLAMNYPSDKLKIMVVDDGSKDTTWSVIQKYATHPQISLHQKENGGKYTALNYGIENSTSEFIGCLDADSFVEPTALKYIMSYFTDKKTMAVTPSMKIQNPDTILGLMQNAEYNLGIFMRKILGYLDAQYVTPGPFSIFRKDVFRTIGKYRHAHNTEDLEMALRMQSNHMRIVNAHKAVVYTVGPRSIYRLYKQRVRWTGGFIQNAVDYKKMIFNPKYGNLGMLVLPVAMYMMVITLFFFIYSLFKSVEGIYKGYENLKAIGWRTDFNTHIFSLEWWYYNVQSTFFLAILMFCIIIFSVWFGKKLAGVKDDKKMDMVYFILIYSLISPFWLFTSIYNTIRNKDAAWR